MTDNDFIGFYELMQISPDTGPETIQRVYRMLPARYRPGNPDTRDTNKFVRLNDAYAILPDRESRAAYDDACQASRARPGSIFNLPAFGIGIDGGASRGRRHVHSGVRNLMSMPPRAPHVHGLVRKGRKE